MKHIVSRAKQANGEDSLDCLFNFSVNVDVYNNIRIVSMVFRRALRLILLVIRNINILKQSAVYFYYPIILYLYLLISGKMIRIVGDGPC